MCEYEIRVEDQNISKSCVELRWVSLVLQFCRSRAM